MFRQRGYGTSARNDFLIEGRFQIVCIKIHTCPRYPLQYFAQHHARFQTLLDCDCGWKQITFQTSQIESNGWVLYRSLIFGNITASMLNSFKNLRIHVYYTPTSTFIFTSYCKTINSVRENICIPSKQIRISCNITNILIFYNCEQGLQPIKSYLKIFMNKFSTDNGQVTIAVRCYECFLCKTSYILMFSWRISVRTYWTVQ